MTSPLAKEVNKGATVHREAPAWTGTQLGYLMGRPPHGWGPPIAGGLGYPIPWGVFVQQLKHAARHRA
eukprot:CAMPEP_0183564086 /NCGR_PEP_ID=MMETSP0371-20130417/104106_1 /TAXON_ID=268820 /ORGANISM="Peridinium aciculiferum, Strain PAER-2" /LENGTH=67 /DNA_ID=CAMNT_0025773045 /DNA_START=7 /DNA_END=211 /DNA_ORIENTATION=+